MSKTIRIGTRSSKLDLWQANNTQEQLKAAGVVSEIVVLKASGSEGYSHPGSLPAALLRGDIDVAVYDLSGLPPEQPEGLVVTAVSRRENPAEWLLIHQDSLQEGALFQLPDNARLGASNALRSAQILDFRPGLAIQGANGDITALVQQLRAHAFDALLLSAASLIRLGLEVSEFHIVPFNPREFVPAPGQGVLAWQTCADDKATRRVLRLIHQPAVSACTNVERRILKFLEGSAQVPPGVYCERDAAGYYHVWAALPAGENGPVQRLRLSQSTNHLLAEKVVEALKG